MRARRLRELPERLRCCETEDLDSDVRARAGLRLRPLTVTNHPEFPAMKTFAWIYRGVMWLCGLTAILLVIDLGFAVVDETERDLIQAEVTEVHSFRNSLPCTVYFRINGTEYARTIDKNLCGSVRRGDRVEVQVQKTPIYRFLWTVGDVQSIHLNH
jgi:hypothetical protein